MITYFLFISGIIPLFYLSRFFVFVFVFCFFSVSRTPAANTFGSLFPCFLTPGLLLHCGETVIPNLGINLPEEVFLAPTSSRPTGISLIYSVPILSMQYTETQITYSAKHYSWGCYKISQYNKNNIFSSILNNFQVDLHRLIKIE